MRMSTFGLVYWVLHSPYPDKTWRGIEKSSAHDDGAPRLFEKKSDAEAFIVAHEMDPYFVPVEVCLVVPGVRRSLRSVGLVYPQINELGTETTTGEDNE